MPSSKDTLDTLMKFAARTGFVYQGSEIYGGLANTWDFGPKGVILRNNIKQAWRSHFVLSRADMYELDSDIFMNSKVWEASGHTTTFADCMVDDKTSKHRFRADHLIEDQLDIDVEGRSPEEITEIIQSNKLKNPITGQPGDWTEARYMNMMFETNRDKIGNDPNQRIYLRPETAQGIFVQFKSVVQSERAQVPFGIAQIGKAFRNEITPGNFMYRIVEFEQMEIEYFIAPPEKDEDWNVVFEQWLELQRSFYVDKMGLSNDNLVAKDHLPEKLSHYSKRTVDWEYKYPFGTKELSGLAYRTDFDLSQHAKTSGKDLSYQDPQTNAKYIPHVIEPSVGVERLVMAVLLEAYTEEDLGEGDSRIVLRLPYSIAPYTVAILPLMKKDGLAEKAEEFAQDLRARGVSVTYDKSGSIGKRYRRQDEIGTPWCVTVDYQTLEDGTVTLRNRDTMEQIGEGGRILFSELDSYISA